jgi:hypothetical protein
MDAANLARDIVEPPVRLDAMPDIAALLDVRDLPPPYPEMNIFPMEWRTETPKVWELYNAARDPGWSPHRLPWHTLNAETSPSISATRWRTGGGCCRPLTVQGR